MHVERPLVLEGEAAGGIVDLHGRETEIGEHDVRSVAPSDFTRRRAKSGEVRAAHEQLRVTEALRAQQYLGLGKLHRIDV